MEVKRRSQWEENQCIPSKNWTLSPGWHAFSSVLTVYFHYIFSFMGKNSGKKIFIFTLYLFQFLNLFLIKSISSSRTLFWNHWIILPRLMAFLLCYAIPSDQDKLLYSTARRKTRYYLMRRRQGKQNSTPYVWEVTRETMIKLSANNAAEGDR